MRKGKRKQMKALTLVVLLVVVLIGSLLFVGAVSGWFDDPKMVLDAEYYSGESEIMELSASKYDELVGKKKSFVVFVNQTGCTTADKLRGFVTEWAKEVGVKVYEMMFSEVKECSLHDNVKHYPSVVVVSKGKPVGYLRTDSDEDADAYNEYEAFKVWIGKYL